MARTEEWTVLQVAKALRKSKGYQTVAARLLGMGSSRTIRVYLDKYPELWDVLDEAREKALDRAEKGLQKLIKEDNLGAITFYLRTQGRDRGYGERTEISLNATGFQIEIPEKFPLPGVVPLQQIEHKD